MKRVREKFRALLHPDKKALEIQDVLKPIIQTVTFLGFLPYSVRFSYLKQKYRAIPASLLFNSLSCFILLSLNFSFVIFHIFLLYSPNLHLLPGIFLESVATLNYVFEFCNYFITSVISYTYSYVNRSKYVKIFNTIVLTWTSIPTTNKGQGILKKLRKQRNVMFIGLIILLIIKLYLTTKQRNIWWTLMVVFTMNIPQLLQIILHGFYTNLVLSVSAILCNLKDQCKSLEKDIKTLNPPFVFNSKLTMTLRQVELVYMKAFELKCDINNLFQVPLLISVIQTFHALVCESYQVYHGIIKEPILTVPEIVTSSIWISGHIIRIYLLSYSGTSLKLESSKIGQALYSLSTERQELRRMMEIEHFSSLLKHQPMEISLCGFFPLDGTLLFKIISSAMTYLIILVQFA